MLPRLSFILAMFVLLLASPSPGLAEDLESKAAKPLFSFKTDDRDPLFGDRFTLKAGYKVWVAKWQAQTVSTTTGSQAVNADHPSALNGPTLTGILKLRDSQWFNALVFNFTWMRDGFDFAEPNTPANRQHFFANRRDYSLTAGLAIWEGFGIFGGYYHSRQEFTNEATDNPPSFATVRHPRTVSGPIIGIFGNIPASERFALYGNLAYAPLKFRGQTLSTFIQNSDSVQGWMVEAGTTINGPRVWKIGTELQLGFRAQIIQKNFGRNATGGANVNATDQLPLVDLTYGPVFTLNAVF